MDNQALRRANKLKNDEFYTLIEDIEKEVIHYKEHFKDKIVYCNCDDPYESNFFKYFAMNFDFFGLKKLICTSYSGSPIVCEQLSLFEKNEKFELRPTIAWKIEIDQAPKSSDGSFDINGLEFKNFVKKHVTKLKGNGDFRSDECLKILNECDIVCTNPPFSLFREYILCLIKSNKKFLVIGNKNSVLCKEIFPLIKENKIWLGYTPATTFLCVSSDNKNTYIQNGKKYAKFGNVGWYTNLETSKRHEFIDLYKQYKGNENLYLKFDNYNAINVDSCNDIPFDYFGIMGVPVNFIDKYNPDQFEIIDGLNRYTVLDVAKTNSIYIEKHMDMRNINGKPKFFRVLIRRKSNG